MSSPFTDKTALTILVGLPKEEPPDTATLAFYDGEMWQDQSAWIGPIPDAEFLPVLKRELVSRNVIREAAQRHIAGVLGREPTWRLVLRRPLGKVPKEQPATEQQPAEPLATDTPLQPPQEPVMVDEKPTEDEQQRIDEGEAALTTWWNERSIHKLIKLLLRYGVLLGSGTARLYVPRGLLKTETTTDGEQQISVEAETLEDAFKLLFAHACLPWEGRLITDDDTQQQAGVYQSSKAGATITEIVYVDDDQTVIRVEELGKDVSTVKLPLTGALTINTLEREPLITETVRQNQRKLTMVLTMMKRNSELAGFLERLYVNAQRPGTYVKNPENESEYIFVPDGELPVGPASASYVNGLPIYDTGGKLTGYTSPSVIFRNPVDLAPLIADADTAYANILGETHQTHALISGDATASGVSREQARAEFEMDLLDSAEQVNAIGRWLLETALRIAAYFAGRAGQFDDLRIDFTCVVSPGPISVEVRQQNVSEYQAKIISRETAQSRAGIEDTDAEQQKIDAEEASKPKPIVVAPVVQQPQQEQA